MDVSLPVLCGVVSTVVFVAGTFPMLAKAYRTRDLASYSLGNIVSANVGNLVNWVYISSLPIGPVWWLHGFNTFTGALMLVWYLRYVPRRAQISPLDEFDELIEMDSSPDADDLAELLASSH